MRERKRNVLLRPPALVVMVALLLAVSGVLYAHWTATLSLDGDVMTGNVGVSWNDAWTNDDGVNNGDGEPFATVWGNPSADPSDWGASAPRHDKGVADCWINDVGGEHLGFQVNNAYPSYYCTITALLGAQGSVPVRATSLAFTGQKAWDDEGGHHEGSLTLWPGSFEGNFAAGMSYPTAEIEGDFSAGVRCGTQLDPMNCRFRFDGTNDGKFWNGPVTWNESGNAFADLDGVDVTCDATECGPAEDYNPNGTPDTGDLPLVEDCDITQEVETSGWIHVLNDASQNASYSFHIEQSFVNWNEFWPGDCTPGAEVASPDGTLYNPERFACPTATEGYVLDFDDCILP